MEYFDMKGQGYFFPPPESGDANETNAWREFRRYDEQNPQIWEEFVVRSKEAMDKGFEKIGAHFILQIIRWYTGVRANGNTWKVSNNHFPYYARKCMQEHPDTKGLFEIRKLTRD